MRTTEIYYILHEAIQAHREVAIQIEAIDCNGSYQEDVIGFIKNSDLLGIYITQLSQLKNLFNPLI